MSYPPTPPPSGGVNPYGEMPQESEPSATTPPPVPPVPPPPTAWGSPNTNGAAGYGSPAYGAPGQQPSAYSPYVPAGNPGSPGYGQPGYGGATPYGWASSRDNGKGTGALVMGILSIVLCFGAILGIGLGVGAILMGVQGRAASRAGTADNGGVATAGMVLGIIGAVLGAIVGLGYLANLVST